MISVSEARGQLGKIYQRRYATWAVRPFDASAPISLGLKPPTDRQVTMDMATVADWLRQWSQVHAAGLQIAWETRRWPNSGTQSIPVRLEAATATALAGFVGQGTHWAAHHERAQKLLALWNRDDSPEAAFDTAVSRILGRVGALDDHDFDRVFDVLDWLRENPESGLFPRQLPVEGIDSKWLERHTGIIRPLHVALGGASDFGLSSPSRLYRTRFLDSELAPGGMNDLMASSGQLARLPITPRSVLIVENLQSLLSLPSMPGVVALHGAGHDVRWCVGIPWVRAASVLYWGDLDADGLKILASLRSVLPETRSLMMDEATLHRFEHLAVRDPKGPGRTTPRGLNQDESAAYEDLREGGGMRLEQERIKWAYALEVIMRAV